MIEIVVPTIGRASLRTLLDALERAHGPRPARIIVVDDRRDRTTPLALGEHDADFAARVAVVAGKAAGPAAARNIGWRASRAAWIAFLDDDVVVGETWPADLARDLAAAGADVAGSTGRVAVPLPPHRRATDWERNVAGLADARWITADCAYRRADLLAVGGFDERFPRAYREDADLALRIVARGRRIVRGERCVTHPVRAADWGVSLRLQAGNADDVLMKALHGRDWRTRAGAPRGVFAQHAATVTAAALALIALGVRRRRAASALAAVWALRTAAFAWRRIAPGPSTVHEIAVMTVTSVALPFVAVAHRLRGYARLRALLRDTVRAPRPLPPAVVFDRDGTLIADVPFNADPKRVAPMPGARLALERLRAEGIATAVVSNQSGVALGRLRRADIDAINARVEALLGPLGPVFVCTHHPDAGCRCRKPAPGLVEDAARALGVEPRDCVVIGDIAADVDAARAAGARAILVPTPVTRSEEVAGAPIVARDLEAAVALLLGTGAAGGGAPWNGELCA